MRAKRTDESAAVPMMRLARKKREKEVIEYRTNSWDEREVRCESLKMNGFYKFLLLGIGLVSLVSYRAWAGTSQPDKPPLTSEQLQVYGDFIESFSKMNFKFLSNRTFPLDLSSVGKHAACLQGLQFEGTEESSKAVHSLGPEVLRGHSIHLIGEQEESAILKQRDAAVAAHGADSTKDASGMTKDHGVLALSEIAFDKSHHFAVLKYVFLCGSHCNSGAILVLEEVGSRWTSTTRRPCSFAVNRDNPRP